jgi:hypothetical protein
MTASQTTTKMLQPAAASSLLGDFTRGRRIRVPHAFVASRTINKMPRKRTIPLMLPADTSATRASAIKK